MHWSKCRNRMNGGPRPHKKWLCELKTVCPRVKATWYLWSSFIKSVSQRSLAMQLFFALGILGIYGLKEAFVEGMDCGARNTVPALPEVWFMEAVASHPQRMAGCRADFLLMHFLFFLGITRDWVTTICFWVLRLLMHIYFNPFFAKKIFRYNVCTF